MRPDTKKLDQIISAARRYQDERALTYRERALKMYPPVCGRCGREFTHKNLRELTVHHKNHDHDDNPLDGSNWELLCLYCHDNEHQRHIDIVRGGPTASGATSGKGATHKALGNLKDLLKDKK
ncbi:MAG: hypothetical protein BMS9Abin36_0624 [Gammaproteobacteria bacterium]|nr:MAG: hypothetical protein BMS9Abin36_0624 [Gammaproteobacteria bacterium]